MVNYQNIYLLCYCLYVSLLSAIMLHHGNVEGKPTGLQEKLGKKHEGTVKTIWAESDVIDCVDIYKQPALKHPLIKDIQMDPSSYPSGMNMEKSQLKIVQDWQRFGECPEGTIPIRRNIQNHDLPIRTSPPPLLRGKLNHSLSTTSPGGNEYATVGALVTHCHGASAKVYIWNPTVLMDPEFSSSQIWVGSNADEENSLNTMEAGWIVHPARYGDSRTRMFIYWTTDNYRATGCFDVDCPGFVQLSNGFAIGSPITNISTYGEIGFETHISIYKNKESGNWWLQLHDFVIGYWPESIFTTFPKHDATILSWGGEIYNERFGGSHTTTEMGSGYFASEGFERAGLMHSLKVVNSSGDMRDPFPESMFIAVTNYACYDLYLQMYELTNHGFYFFYGGPGGCAQKCQ